VLSALQGIARSAKTDNDKKMRLSFILGPLFNGQRMLHCLPIRPSETGSQVFELKQLDTYGVHERIFLRLTATSPSTPAISIGNNEGSGVSTGVADQNCGKSMPVGPCAL
jgi:hypothetical protein